MNGEQTRKYPETIETHPDQPPWYIYDLGDTQRLGSPTPMTDDQVDREIELFGHPEQLVPDDTVPVERLAAWLHGQYGGAALWARIHEDTREGWRQDARSLRADLPELFR